VYLAALVGPMLVDALTDSRDVRLRLRNAGYALGALAVLAAPWWLSAGPAAIHYLLHAGYSTDSVFVANVDLMTRITQRMLRTINETGVLVIAVLVVGATLSVLAAENRETSSRSARARLLVASSVVLGMLGLGTSSNSGTAFALPFVVLLATLAACGYVDLTQDDELGVGARWAGLGASALVASFTVGAVLVAHVPPAVRGVPLWLSGTPVRGQVQQALGCACPVPDGTQLNARLYALTNGQPVLTVRDDAIINPFSLRYQARVEGKELNLSGPPAGATLLDPQLLKGIGFVVAGTTAGPYLRVDPALAQQTLTGLGWTPVLREQLSPNNTVILYKAPAGVDPG
jgi:hypothetical protein